MGGRTKLWHQQKEQTSPAGKDHNLNYPNRCNSIKNRIKYASEYLMCLIKMKSLRLPKQISDHEINLQWCYCSQYPTDERLKDPSIESFWCAATSVFVSLLDWTPCFLIMWSLRASLRENWRWHIGHVKGLTPEWALRCLSNLCFHEVQGKNCFPHSRHRRWSSSHSRSSSRLRDWEDGRNGAEEVISCNTTPPP